MYLPISHPLSSQRIGQSKNGYLGRCERNRSFQGILFLTQIYFSSIIEFQQRPICRACCIFIPLLLDYFSRINMKLPDWNSKWQRVYVYGPNEDYDPQDEINFIEPDHNANEGMDEASIREHEEVTKVKVSKIESVFRFFH